MIGRGLKKIAKSYNMTVENGCAYGQIFGYLFTLCEGMGYKRMCIALPLELDDIRRQTISGFINEKKTYYKISNQWVYDRYVEIMFFDTIGTKQKMVEFIGEISSKFSEMYVTKGKVCDICLDDKDENMNTILLNNAVLYAHDSCALTVSSAVQEQNESFASEKKNHLLGALGAVVGGLVGTIPWIIVYMMGFFVGWLGFVIGLAANKGYTLFKGKNSKLKPWIIILAVILCVIAAQFIAESVEVIRYFNSEGYTNYTLIDVAETIVYTFIDVPEYKASVISNIALGFLFAGLGVLNLIKKLTMDSKDSKIAVLGK